MNEQNNEMLYLSNWIDMTQKEGIINLEWKNFSFINKITPETCTRL